MSTTKNPEINKKWHSRRLIVGGTAWVSITFAFVYCINKGVDIGWFNAYTWATTVLALFIGGYLTATDMINKWKK